MAGDDSKAPKPEEIEHQQHDAIRQHELRDAEALRAIHPEIPLEEVLESHTELDSKRVKRIIRKLDFRLISILGLVYVWAFIDRGNLGNANIAGMSDDLDTNVGHRYSILTMIFFIGYILVDIPSTYITRRIGPAIWIGSICIAWSAVTIGQGFVKSWGALAVCRILLGFMEGGLVPGAVYLLSAWYTRWEIGSRIAAFYVVGVVSGGISGLLAYGIEKMEGTAGIRGWRWIFIIEGAISAGVGLLCYVLIVDFPEKAARKNWLARLFGLQAFLTPEEVAIVLARIEHDRGDAVEEEKLTRKLFFTYLQDWKVWEFPLYLMLNNTALYAFAYFLPVILKDGFGYSTAKTQIMTFPPYVVGGVYMVFCAWLGDKLRTRGPIMVVNSAIFIVGIVMIGWCTNTNARYAGTFIGQIGMTGNIPNIWAYAQNNLIGQKKKGLCLAMITMAGAMGGIIAGNAFRAQDKPGYRTGLGVSIAFNILTAMLLIKNFFIFGRANRKVDRGELVIMGQPGFKYTL
ncbi:uncharacterized protein PV06_01539 [Exophiala oligosperma]|uniref:Major facilitator superfamily (MFS) profile domain-containing protein n=2 Tax=Chaetothyriales TaxID=34395 RepID=A0A0D2DS48_9EURO|nr:uncharacterized protein PV06_01539 [Exophiala oligosperma]KAJ9636493.1 hypothetical protein H2204_005326 [Knufia peltigerae]KIW45828.1 hypothetical protein PV06_01539 [Exophiala oligosperma]